MKKIILLLAILITSFAALSQLRGSGKTISKIFVYQNFNKVNFDDLDGKLEIYFVEILINEYFCNSFS